MIANHSGPTIQVDGLRKSYGRQVVLDGIDFEVAQGTVYSLLGPNGAGKTTTVQILSTLISADEGHVPDLLAEVENDCPVVRFFSVSSYFWALSPCTSALKWSPARTSTGARRMGSGNISYQA